MTETLSKYIAAIGTAMVIALVVAVTVAKSDAANDRPPSDAHRLSAGSGTDGWRDNKINSEFSVCAADYDGTLSCAVSHG